jgi:orotidine-5'-phosphate decarboxylase
MPILKNSEKLCLALDLDCPDEALRFVNLLKDYIGFFKIGFQLFLNEGPKIINDIKKLGGRVFLDLKFHDIPNTVANAAKVATKCGVDIFNIHASGGREMMTSAVKAAKEESFKLNIKPPIILAVTVLTSLDDMILHNELHIQDNALNHVVHLAKLAKSSGIDGVVSSPKEAAAIRKNTGNDFVILTPGIRPSWSASKDDQKRITTPKQAIEEGANIIVLGRPILKADDPLEATKKILHEISNS